MKLLSTCNYNVLATITRNWPFVKSRLSLPFHTHWLLVIGWKKEISIHYHLNNAFFRLSISCYSFLFSKNYVLGHSTSIRWMNLLDGQSGTNQNADKGWIHNELSIMCILFSNSVQKVTVWSSILVSTPNRSWHKCRMCDGPSQACHCCAPLTCEKPAQFCNIQYIIIYCYNANVSPCASL